MGLFGCRACAAKDEEIRWLRHELEVERRAMVEMAKPGLSHVVEPEVGPKRVEIPKKEKPERKRQPTMPGYEPAPLGEVEVT